MANVEEESFERQQKRCTELIDLRQKIKDHDMDPAGVDLAIANVFESNKGHLIDPMISDGKSLVTLMIQLNALGIDATNVKMALGKAFVPGMSGSYGAGLLRLNELIKMREQMAKVGIPTGSIEATIAEVFRPQSSIAMAIKPEEEHGQLGVKSCLQTAEIVEPAELDASATTISKQVASDISKPAEESLHGRAKTRSTGFVTATCFQ